MTRIASKSDGAHVHALFASLESALRRREPLLASLAAEDTDCYRLLHGTNEGRPGLTVDRYGATLLVQSFHEPLAVSEVTAVESWYRSAHPHFVEFAYHDRSARNSRIRAPAHDDAPIDSGAGAESSPGCVREVGVAHRFRARHRGQDPWLFLDLRVARRFVKREAAASVLNLFAYTCGVGTAAAVGGASRVLNVDFARSSLAVGRESAALNGVEVASSFLVSDFFPAVRQLAGLGLAKPRRHGDVRPTPQVDAESFDLVFLDPPRYAKSAFGVVDLVHDYGGVFKPSLLATRVGGTLVCCNNVADVPIEPWLESLERGVRRHGRVLRDREVLVPDADFPSVDGRTPLKVAVLRV